MISDRAYDDQKLNSVDTESTALDDAQFLVNVIFRPRDSNVMSIWSMFLEVCY